MKKINDEKIELITSWDERFDVTYMFNRISQLNGEYENLWRMCAEGIQWLQFLHNYKFKMLADEACQIFVGCKQMRKSYVQLQGSWSENRDRLTLFLLKKNDILTETNRQSNISKLEKRVNNTRLFVQSLQQEVEANTFCRLRTKVKRNIAELQKENEELKKQLQTEKRRSEAFSCQLNAITLSMDTRASLQEQCQNHRYYHAQCHISVNQMPAPEIERPIPEGRRPIPEIQRSIPESQRSIPESQTKEKTYNPPTRAGFNLMPGYQSYGKLDKLTPNSLDGEKQKAKRVHCENNRPMSYKGEINPGGQQSLALNEKKKNATCANPTAAVNPPNTNRPDLVLRKMLKMDTENDVDPYDEFQRHLDESVKNIKRNILQHVCVHQQEKFKKKQQEGDKKKVGEILESEKEITENGAEIQESDDESYEWVDVSEEGDEDDESDEDESDEDESDEDESDEDESDEDESDEDESDEDESEEDESEEDEDEEIEDN